jgi:hypothetical protein
MVERMSRTDPAYQERVLGQKGQNDPKEIAIREKIRSAVLRENWARAAFDDIRDMQIEFLRAAARNIGDPNFVHDEAQAVLGEIAQELHSEIIEGKELLASIPKGSPAIIATNHFGAYKLLGISPKDDVGVDIPGYDAMYPYLMYFAALKPVAEAIGDELYYASNDFPGVFGQIHSAAGFIHVPALAESKTAALIDQTRTALERRPHAAIVNFPEGTTSGKPSGRGPYDLEPYKTGGYVVAAELGMHVIPVAQYFDPVHGYHLKVFQPFIPAKGTKESYAAMAERNQSESQAWFDQLQVSTARTS